MVEFSGLSVAISARTADFQAGVSAAKDAATDLSFSLRRLGSSADEAEDEVSSAGRSAATSAVGFQSLSSAVAGSSVSFTGLSTALTASLLPALAAVAAVAAPLVGTFALLASGAAGLAAAFGAVVGSGLVAFGRERGQQNARRLKQIEAQIRGLERLEDRTGVLTRTEEQRLESLKETRDELEDQTGVTGGLESAFADLRDQLVPIIAGFGEKFAPLIEDALGGIPGLVENILGAVGGLDTFAATLRRLGERAAGALPDLAVALVGIAEEALPVFLDFVDVLAEQGPAAFSDLLDAGREVAPTLLDLADAVAAFGPELLEVGASILETAGPALVDFLEVIDDGLERFASLDTQTQGIIGTIAALTPIVLGVTNTLSALIGALGGTTAIIGALQSALTVLSGPVGIIIALVVALGAAFATNFADIRTTTLRVVSQLVNIFNNTLGPSLRQLLAATVEFLQGARDGFQLLRPVIEPAVAFLADALGSALVSAVDLAATTIAFFIELLLGDFSEATTLATNFIRRFAARSTRFVERWGIIDEVTNKISSIIGSIAEFATRLPTLFVLGLSKAIAVASSLLDDLFSAFRGILNAIAAAVETTINGIIRAFGTGIDAIIGEINQLIEAQNRLTPREANIGQLGGFEAPSVDLGAPVGARAEQSRPARRGARAANRLAVELGIDVPDDSKLAEFIQENASLEVADRQRRQSDRIFRETGGAPQR